MDYGLARQNPRRSFLFSDKINFISTNKKGSGVSFKLRNGIWVKFEKQRKQDFAQGGGGIKPKI